MFECIERTVVSPSSLLQQQPFRNAQESFSYKDLAMQFSFSTHWSYADIKTSPISKTFQPCIGSVRIYRHLFCIFAV